MARRIGRLGWASVAITTLGLSALGRGALAAPPEPTAAQAMAYSAPDPIRIYRFHVYSTMKSRWKKTVMIDSLVSTSKGGVAMGDRGLLERQLDSASGTEWAPVAKVVVTKLLPKGRLQVEIESEEGEAKVKRNGKLPYAPGQKVRLQIDRVLSGG